MRGIKQELSDGYSELMSYKHTMTRAIRMPVLSMCKVIAKDKNARYDFYSNKIISNVIKKIMETSCN